MSKLSWISLSKSKEDVFSIGTVFRCKGEYPHEEIVDFILINYPHFPSGHALIVASGYKAGHTVVALPAEAMYPNTYGISVQWVKENWKKWIYSVGPKTVFYTKHYIVDQNWTPKNR